MSLSCGVNASPAVRTTAGPLSSRPTPAAVVAHPAAASAFQRVESAVSSAHEADERARAAERGALGALESFSQRLGRVEGTSSQWQNQLQSVEGRVDTLAAAVDAAGSRGQGHGGGEARAGGQGGGGGEGGALAAEVARLRDVIAEKDSADQAALENEKKASADPRATPLWSAQRGLSAAVRVSPARPHRRALARARAESGHPLRRGQPPGQDGGGRRVAHGGHGEGVPGAGGEGGGCGGGGSARGVTGSRG